MLTFKTYITEGNLLQQRIHKHLSSGKSVGAISPEGPHTDTPEKKKNAHKEIRKDLEHARKHGHIGGWSGPHKGEYQYGSGSHDVAREGSYLVHSAGHSEEHHKNMVKSLSHIGNKHNQESIFSADHKGQSHWHHLKASPKSGEKEFKGTIHYDVKLKKSEGRTSMKRGGHSFTTK